MLFTNQREEDSHMEVLLLQTGERRVLLEEGGMAVRYVPTGHLVFVRDKTLYAVSFDLEKLKVKGSVKPVVQGISESDLGCAHFAFSENGTLLYLPALPDKRSLVYVGRTGVVEPVGVPPRPYKTVRVSPDGNLLALTIDDKEDKNIWIFDRARLTHRQLTFDGKSWGGIWTQDGKRVIFDRDIGRPFLPMWTLADGSGQAEPLTEAEKVTEKNDFWFWVSYCLSPDGSCLLGGRTNIWVLPMESKGDPWPFITMADFQRHPAFSPNGQWVAYDSTETGRAEVYVRSFPGPGSIETVSTEGGYEPIWSRDGKELFYRNADKMMFVTIETEQEFKAGVPQELFKGQFWGSATEFYNTYDVAPDGRFLMFQEPGGSTPLGINVVLNWFDQLKKLVPTGKGE